MHDNAVSMKVLGNYKMLGIYFYVKYNCSVAIFVGGTSLINSVL